MMPSKVSDLLPRAISDWFKGRRQTNTNGSVPEADTPEPTPEREPERTQSPPAKRARYEPSASITNYYAPPEIISTPRPDDQAAGPSGHRAEPIVASPPSREGRSERWPDLPRSGGNRSVARINLFRRSDPTEDNSGKTKDAPSTPAASKRPHSTSGSPFYAGRTRYGGAGASATYLNAPNIRRRATAVLAAPLHDVDNSVSSATRRLMGLLESCGSPPGERRVQARAPAGLDGTRSLIGQSVAPSFSSSYKTQELRVSQLPTLLRLKQGAQLRESTRAARQMADASALAAPYPAVAAPPRQPASSGEMTTSTPWAKHSNKMKSQVGRNSARKGAQTTIDTEIVPPLNLPSGILNIDATNLPKISFSANIDLQIPKNTAVEEKPEEKLSEFKFSKPTGVIETQSVIPTSKSKFTFSKPEDISQRKKMTNGPQKPKDFDFGFTKPSVKENGELPVKNWKCDDCWVVNKDDSVKCIACGGSKPALVAKPTVVKEVVKDWQCKDCWVFNKDAVKNCIACGGSKPTAGAKSTETNIAKSLTPVVKDWQCKDCWVFNKADVQKCIACGGSNTEIVKANPPIEKSKDWKCQDCWVMNKDEVLKCVACGGSKPKSIAKSVDAKSKNWQCKDCWVFNKDEVKHCIACGGSKPTDSGAVKIQSGFGTNIKSNSLKWTCGDCWVTNDDNVSKCIACGGLNPKKSSNSPSYKGSISTCGIISKDNKFSDLVKKQTEQWECATCLARNNNSVAKCACCETPKPGAKINEESAKFNFPATPTSFKFGIPASNTAEIEKKTKAAEEDKSTKGILNVDSSKSSASKTVTFTFGVPKPVTDNENKSVEKEEAKEAPKFSFGTPIKAQDPVSFKLPETSLNKTHETAGKSEVDGSKLPIVQNSKNDKDTESSTLKLPSMNTPISFNLPANPSQLSKSSVEKTTNEPAISNPPGTLFGVPLSIANTQGSLKYFNTLPKTSESTGTLFGISSNTTKTEVSCAAFSNPSNTATTTATAAPLFGVPSTAVTTQVSSTLFGIPSNSTKTTEPSTALFGIPSNSVKTTEASSSLFGISKTSDGSGTLFGKTSETAPTLFGISSAMGKPTEASSSTLFGTPPNAAKTEASSTLFGIQPNVAKSTENTPTLFGMPSNTAKPSETTSTLFGMPSNAAKTTETTPTLFGMPSSAVKPSETTPTLFGMPSSVAKTSEASPALFGVPSNATKRSDTPTLFGVSSNVSITTEVSLAATTKASMFPSSTGAFALPKVDNPASSQPAPLFSFGTNAQEPAKPATPSRFNFSFGGTSTESAPPSFNATFGASTTQQPSNPTPAVPSFAMPNNSMFGAQPQTNLFGSSVQSDASKPASSQNKAPFSFGAPSNTMFGAQPQTNTTANASVFGAQGAMFGGSQAAKPSELFPSSSSALFAGQPANNNPAPMAMFGAPSMGSNATFGAAPSTNPSGGLGQAAAGQAPAFNFGANTTPTMFGFGQQAAPAQPGVYSFGGGAAPGVQFSLGTTAGTPQAAAPGARRVRKAVRRTQR